MTVLREQLLAGHAIALGGGVSGRVQSELEGLGARVELVPGGDGLADDELTSEWARARAPLDALVHDAAGAFASGGGAGLVAAMEQCWVAIRAVVTGALIPSERPGKVLLIGPRPDAGAFADAARAGLENLVRTVSVEWARYGITAATISPGRETTDQELAELVCFAVSPAGGYLSGCRLELGSVPE
jgi:NAD(P)-dependent dehydrogenase (short-subunit alcohol dehydrogenase family)